MNHTDYTENCVSFLLFLLFWGFNHHNEPCHRHKDISFYHILSTKISPPRMRGKLPASGHWRFHLIKWCPNGGRNIVKNIHFVKNIPKKYEKMH